MSSWYQALVALSFLVVSSLGFAQEETPPAADNAAATEAPAPAESPSDKRVEKLEVTGSHIKRIDVEGPSPILTLDRDYLDRTGFNNIGDVLRETTVASFGGARENSLQGGAGTGASTTSLRGFDAERILILLDGRRLPTIGGSSSVDLALIPMAAVERIEILKDGASAIYGSDALGGVINVITKKDYDGSSVELGFTTPEAPGGERTDVRASYGATSSKGSILGVVQYRRNEPTWNRDYDYARPPLSGLSPTGSPGSWLDPTNGWQAGSAADPCPPDQVRAVNPNDPSAGNVCAFDFSPFMQITPLIDQYSAMVTGDYKINSELKWFGTAVATQRNVSNQLAPAPDNFRDATSTGGLNTTITQGTAAAWGLPATGDLPFVRYRLVEEGGPRRGEVNSFSYNVNTGLQGYLSETWDWEFSATHGGSQTENRGVGGYANKRILHEMAEGTGAFNQGDFNPFAAPGNKSDISNALYQPVDGIFSTMTTVNLKASGEIAELPAGPLSVAVGVSNAWQTFELTADAVTAAGEQWGGGVVATGKGLRDFQSAFTEFYIPVLTDLEVQLAGRFDHFSDFGSTVNPKVGVRYKPLDEVMLRASWGTGFRAPSLEDLYRGQTLSFPQGTDLITGFEGQFEQVSGGNRNLQEETTESVNVGLVLQPLQDLSITADYWKASQDGVVTVASTRDIFLAESRNPSALAAAGVRIDRDCPTCAVNFIENPSINAASVDVSGLDLGLSYKLPVFADFNLRAAVDHSMLFEYLYEPFPGLGLENRVGFAGIPYWRNNVSLSFGNPTYDLGLTLRTIGETNYSIFEEVPGTNGKTRDHTELDLRLQYVAPWNGTFAFLVRNVFNTDRPWSLEFDSPGFLNASLYDPFGRTYGLNYRQDF